MFNFDIKDLESNLSSNNIISKKIDIDENLSCFILIDSDNKKIIDVLLNKIIDYVLDNISLKDTYNKFSVTLESINFFIKNLKSKENNIEELNILIGILEKNTFHFSKIGKISCSLLNNKKGLIEISDKNDKKTTFDYISSGKLLSGEIIIMSNAILNDILTNTDISDISNINNVENINENIIKILQDEKIEKTVKILTLKYESNDNIIDVKDNFLLKFKILFYKSLDNNFSKKVIALSMILKEKIEKKGKITKNIVFLSAILIATFSLYSIISGIVGSSIQSSKNDDFKINLIQAREYIRLANENLANPEIFDLNIAKAEELVNIVKAQNVYINDIDDIVNDMSIIKKQFNGIGVFDNNTSNLIFAGNFKDSVKLLELNKKLYVIGKSSVYGPIVLGQNIKDNIFEDLEVDDEFLDASIVGEDIILVTKKNRIVRFGKDSKFKYINVIGQDSWQSSSFIESYNGNIYLTNKNSNQIYKHSPSSGSFTSGVSYLNDNDSKNIGKILSISIDGGIYMLKNDLSIIKFFSSPKYRIESILLNKLPKNYNLENPNIFLTTRNNLNNIYLFMNNKIWIFIPNTKLYTDTKSLTYMGQIEVKNEIIKGFYVPRDSEINILTEKGIYRLTYEIKDDNLIIR